MKKRIIALSTSLLLLFMPLVACNSEESESLHGSSSESISRATESQQVSETEAAQNGDTAADPEESSEPSESEWFSSDIPVESDEAYESEASEFCEPNDDEGLNETNIEVADGYGTYVIDEAQRNGFYLSTFTMETEEIVLADGRRIPLNYSEFAYDEETKTHQAVINGRNYRLSEYTDYEGVLCQSLECIDEIDGYAITASVLYYPELEYGNITMGFVIEKNENGEYKFTYPDGHSETRKVLFDEELGMYYFE